MMVNNNNMQQQQQQNPTNRSSISNFSHSHQQQQQHLRQQSTNVANNSHPRPQQQQQQPGLNRAVQRPVAGQHHPQNSSNTSGGQHHHHHHHQSQQQQQQQQQGHHNHHSSSSPAGVNRPTANTQNGVNPRPAATGQPGSTQPGQNRPRPAQQQQQQQQQQGANPSQQQQPPPPQLLPKGWKREEVIRMRGITAGLADVVYGPTAAAVAVTTEPALAGQKFKTKRELQRAIGDKYDVALLDWRSGKLSQVALRKQRRVKSIAANPGNLASAAKYDPSLCVPSRQTAGVFKQSVSYVTSGHRNEPTPAHILNPSLLLNNPNSAAVVQQLTQNQIVALSKNLDRVKPTQVCFFFFNLEIIEFFVINFFLCFSSSGS
jgi:hypothetical protein